MSFSDLKIKRIKTDADTLIVPLAYYPTLLHATDAERKNCQPIGAGYGIELPELDYHLSVEGLMQGLPEALGLRRMKAVAYAVTGKTASSSLYHPLEVLDKEKSLTRIGRAIDKL